MAPVRLARVTIASIVAALAVLLVTGAAGANAHTSCAPPGKIGRFHVYALSEIHVGCGAANHGVHHFIARRSAPTGYTCRQDPIGYRDTRLSCHNSVGSFHASWHVGDPTH
jgi:hypothetical protein